MTQKTMVDVIAEESTRFIKLPFFLTALGFSPINKGCDITTEVFFRLLDKGLKLHLSEPGNLYYRVKISSGVVKRALLMIDNVLFDTDMPRGKLFSQQIIKTESGNEIKLGDIFIGRDNVKQLYFNMSLDSYPWVKVPWPSSEVDCMDHPVDRSNNKEFDVPEWLTESSLKSDNPRKLATIDSPKNEINKSPPDTRILANDSIKAINIPQEQQKTCGKRGIHKVIKRAFYSIDKFTNDIKPIDVFNRIKMEKKSSNESPIIDEDLIIEEIKNNDISWKTQDGNTSSLKYKHFSELVRKLKKPN